MAVGQENGRAVLAHDGAGRAGRVVGNVVFREILIVNGKRAARQEGEILARSGNVQNLLADWKRAEHCPVIPDGQGGIAVSGLIEIHDERDEAVSVQRVVLEIGVLKGVAAEALAVQLIEIQRVFTQDAERVSGQEMQIVDQGISRWGWCGEFPPNPSGRGQQRTGTSRPPARGRQRQRILRRRRRCSA